LADTRRVCLLARRHPGKTDVDKVDKSRSKRTASRPFAEISPVVEGLLMGAAVDYAARAEECRRLAKVYTRPEDWAHFIEMAETWEMLLKQQQEKLKQQQEKLKQQQEKLKQQQEKLKQQQEELNQQQEKLKQQQERSRLQTIALADQFRDVLFLSDIAAKPTAKENKSDRAA
jgi:DNA anti-recombination protein RmuC